MLIEPTYSTEINSDRIKETNYIAYHVTLKKYEDSIKKEGLKIRNKKPGKQKYREFPQRIYFFLNKDFEYDSEETKNYVKQLYGRINSELKRNGYSVFRINLKGLSYNFYEDTVSIKDGCIFCYNNIPASRLQLVASGITC